MAYLTALRNKKNNFMVGMSRSIDLFGRLSNANNITSLVYSDMKAICFDWQIVGSDFKKVMKDYGKKRTI